MHNPSGGRSGRPCRRGGLFLLARLERRRLLYAGDARALPRCVVLVKNEREKGGEEPATAERLLAAGDQSIYDYDGSLPAGGRRREWGVTRRPEHGSSWDLRERLVPMHPMSLQTVVNSARVLRNVPEAVGNFEIEMALWRHLSLNWRPQNVLKLTGPSTGIYV